MLDGADPGADGVLDAVGRLGVRHHRQAGRGRLGHQHGQFVGPVVGVLRAVPRRQHPAGRAHLDHVGARADDLPDPFAHLVGAVHDPGRAARVRHALDGGDPRRQPAVAVTRGLAQHRDRDAQLRALDQAVGDRPLHAEVRAAGVAHGGDPAVEGGPQVGRRLEELVRERPLQVAQEVDARAGHVHVAVDETRGQGQPGHVHVLIPVEAGADVGDQATGDQDVPGRDGTARAVEDLPAVQNHRAHAALLSLTQESAATGRCRAAQGCPAPAVSRGGAPAGRRPSWRCTPVREGARPGCRPGQCSGSRPWKAGTRTVRWPFTPPRMILRSETSLDMFVSCRTFSGLATISM